VGLSSLLLVLQLVPVDRENPPVEAEVPAGVEVRAVLSRACYDCHSNETRWPWYAYVAPVLWLVAHDVAEARDHVNFSTWNVYDEDERRAYLDQVWEAAEADAVPLWFYVPLHPDAELSEADRALIHRWVRESEP